MTQDGPIPLGPRTFHGKPIPSSLRVAIGPALDHSRRQQGADRLLRVVDLLLRAGVVDDRLQVALANGVLPGLADPRCADAHRCRRPAVAGGVVAARRRPGGQRHRRRRPGLAGRGRLRCPSRLNSPRPGPGFGVDPRRAARPAVASAWSARHPGDARCAAVVAADYRPGELRRPPQWRRSGIRRICCWPSVPIRCPGRAALRTLVGAADSAALHLLAGKVIEDNDDGDGGGGLRGRPSHRAAGVAAAAVSAHPPEFVCTAVGSGAGRGWNRSPSTRISRCGCWRSRCWACSPAQPYPQACNALAAESGYGAQAVARVLPFVDGGQLAPVTVVAISLLRTAAAEVRRPCPRPGGSARGCAGRTGGRHHGGRRRGIRGGVDGAVVGRFL